MKKLFPAVIFSVSFLVPLCSTMPAVADGWIIGQRGFTPDANNPSPIGGATTTLTDNDPGVSVISSSSLTPPPGNNGVTIASAYWAGSYSRQYVWSGYGPSSASMAAVYSIEVHNYANGPDAALGHSSASSSLSTTQGSTQNNNNGTPSNKSYDISASGGPSVQLAAGTFSGTLTFRLAANCLNGSDSSEQANSYAQGAAGGSIMGSTGITGGGPPSD